MRTELFHANNVAATRENEFEGLKKQNLELQWVIHNQEVRRAQTCEECRRRSEGAQIDRWVIGIPYRADFFQLSEEEWMTIVATT